MGVASSTKPMRLLAAGLLLAVAGCHVSQQLSISAEHGHKQQEGYRVPNDDLHLAADYSSYTHHKLQYQYQQQQQQQQQQHQQYDKQQQQRERPVINGNQATFVEPPADFKPIIYEQDAVASLEADAATAAEHSDLTNQLAARPHQNARQPADVNHRLSAAGTSQHQELGFRPAPAPGAANNQDDKLPVDEMTGGMALDSEQSLAAANVLPLKPSIGRWSDWHDMSIEPDLAASDSLLEPVSSSSGSTHPAPLKSGLKTRYGWSADNGAIKSPRGVNANALIRQQQQQQQQPLPLALGASTDSLQRVHRQRPQASAAPMRLLALNVEGPRSDQFYAANLISLQQVGGRPSAPHWPPPPHQLEGGLDNRRPSAHLMSAALHEQQQQQQQFRQQPLYLVAPAFLQAPPSPMHFFMAHNQAPHHLKPRQRSQFAPASADQDNLLIQRRESRPKLPQANARQDAEVRLIQSAGGRVLAQSAPLMSAKEAARVFALADASRTTVKPAGSQVSGSAVPAIKLAGANSARSGTNSSSKPRVLKRRRIKTQLPVGLSSWMLGGIRDLDARHWKLPAEVLSKLAVNDVDLAHPEQPASGGANNFVNSADSGREPQPVAAVSALERAGPALASSSTQRAPSPQQIPR